MKHFKIYISKKNFKLNKITIKFFIVIKNQSLIVVVFIFTKILISLSIFALIFIIQFISDHRSRCSCSLHPSRSWISRTLCSCHFISTFGISNSSPCHSYCRGGSCCCPSNGQTWVSCKCSINIYLNKNKIFEDRKYKNQ